MNSELAQWCLDEVIVQYDEIEDIEPLYNACIYAEARRNELHDPSCIERIGQRVKPTINRNGWRRHAVFIGLDEGASWREIPRLMQQLGDALERKAITPTEWFIEFEKIHPFGDGNGRTGAIVANILMGNLPRMGRMLLSYEIHSFRGDCKCEVCMRVVET